MTQTNKISIGIITGLVLVIGVLLGSMYVSKSLGANPVANSSGIPVALLGSRVGTTTIGVAFYTGITTASTTYPFRIGSNVDEVSLILLATGASTTGATVSFSILGSNDPYCDTASTTGGTLNPVITSDITWFDATSHILNLAGSITGLNAATSTVISYTPAYMVGEEISLTNLNTECLALRLTASSTILSAQFLTKSFRKD